MRDHTLDGETCFYCDALLPNRRELDHFPIQRRFGGKEVVAACMNCHELKDRSIAADWPVDYVLSAVLCLPLRKMELVHDLMACDRLLLDTYLDELLEDWSSLPSGSRLILAKLIRIVVAMSHGERPTSSDGRDLATLPEIPVRRAA